MLQQKKKALSETALVVCCAALYLFVNLFASLRVPYLIGGDQAFFWLRAMRMLNGDRIYRDFLQFTQPPGLDLVFLSLFKVFGLRMWVTSLVVLALGVASCWMIFSIARRFMRPASAVLAAAVFLVPIYGKAINATHHWFSVLAVLAAVRVVIEGLTAQRLAVAGAILGLGSFLSTYHGLVGLVAFCIFLLLNGARTQPRWEGLLRGLALLVGTYVATLGLLYSHYLVTGGSLAELWYFQVTYVRDFAVEAYRSVQELFPLPVSLHNLVALSDCFVVYLLLAATIAGAIFLCWKRRRSLASNEPAVLLTLVAVLLFAEVAVSPSWLRIYAVSAPAAILAGWVVDQLPRPRVAVSVVLWGWILILGAHQTIARHRMQRAIIELPAGRVAMTPEMAAKLSVVSQFAKPGADLFQAAWPGVYVPLHLRDGLSFETINPSDSRGPEDIESARRQLEERHVPYVLWAARLDTSCCNSRLTPLREYVHAAYAPVATLPDGDTLWRRRE